MNQPVLSVRGRRAESADGSCWLLLAVHLLRSLLSNICWMRQSCLSRSGKWNSVPDFWQILAKSKNKVIQSPSKPLGEEDNLKCNVHSCIAFFGNFSFNKLLNGSKNLIAGLSNKCFSDKDKHISCVHFNQSVFAPSNARYKLINYKVCFCHSVNGELAYSLMTTTLLIKNHHTLHNSWVRVQTIFYQQN